MQTLKNKIKDKLTEMGADINDFRFKYYKESPYQKKRFKPQFVESECWIYHTKNNVGKEGYVLTDEGFNEAEYSIPYLEMIIQESKIY
jgi:hypothetical protein